MENLLINPVNCDLPCWWDAVPGENNWYEVERFLRTFTTQIRHYAMPNDLVGYGVIVNIPEGINPSNQIGPFYTINNKGIVETIEVALGNLPNLLTQSSLYRNFCKTLDRALINIAYNQTIRVCFGAIQQNNFSYDTIESIFIS